MADPNSDSPPQHQRRKSFVEMLNPRSHSTNNTATVSTSPSNTAVQASPAVPTGRKSSLSIALGLAGGSNADSPYNAFARQRRASISTSSASGSPEFRNSFDDGAVIEEDDKMGPMATPPSPSFARRLSFGAQALRDVRQTGTSPNAGRRPSSALFTWNEDSDHIDANSSKSTARPTPGTAMTGGEGFTWSDSMRDRTKRPSFTGNPFSNGNLNRSKSVNSPSAQEPPKEIPKPAPQAPAPLRSRKPDHLGERMLRGDFMMD